MTPHAWVEPTLTDVNFPGGGMAASGPLLQQAIDPSAFTPQP
ncbi:MAG: hypothetical protein OXH41_08995 [Chloroflexi bacterium]|nr:hypothetical protein [Chloroflexota bacterium]